MIPAVPLAAKAEYDYFPAENGYDVFIVANNVWENTFSYNYKNPNNQYRAQTIGTINPAVKGKITGFTIVYETTKNNPNAFSDSDIAELDQMIDKELLQQLMDDPVPDAASAKAQFDNHVAQIRSRPAARRDQASNDGDVAATPQAPTKPKKPKLRLPGGLPRIPGI